MTVTNGLQSSTIKILTVQKPLKAYRFVHPQWGEEAGILWAISRKKAKGCLLVAWLDAFEGFGTFGQTRITRAPEYDHLLPAIWEKPLEDYTGRNWCEETVKVLLPGVQP